VGQLTVHRYLALCEEWRETPPLPVLLKAALGIKTGASPSGRASADGTLDCTTEEGAAKFLALWGEVGGKAVTG